MRTSIVSLTAVIALAACSSTSSQSFALTSASVDPTYFCPGGASNAPYDLHGTVNVHNGTSAPVTIKSVSAQMTLASVRGDWLEKVGDRFDAPNLTFTPQEVAAGANGSLSVTIPSACTSGKYGTGVSSSGDYDVRISVQTSAGTYSITAGNRHEIVGA